MNIYRITLDDLNDPNEGLLAISLVDFPAVEENFLKFRNEKKATRLTLKSDDQRIITGVALLADTPIYRYSPTLGEYYIVFEKETIRDLVQKYSKDGLLNVINLQHDAETYSVESCTMIESYFVNHDRGICPEEFKSVPDGSWIVSFKVNDDDLWHKIKASNGEEGGLNGFSVEVVADIAPKLKKEEVPDLDEFVSGLVSEKFGVTKGDVRHAIESKKILEIVIGDKTYTGQIKELGKKGDKVIANMYLPGTGKWHTIDVSKISYINITEQPLAPWSYDDPSYDQIVNDEDIVVTDSIIASKETIEAAMDGQFFVGIQYDDESEEHQPATGMRQIQVCAYGTTLKGNECFRAYEWFGDTSGSLPGGTGNWRIFLTRRCRSFRILKFVERWGTLPPGYRTGDVDMKVIYKEIVPGDVNPYPASIVKR